jgi:hypothetical protein
MQKIRRHTISHSKTIFEADERLKNEMKQEEQRRDLALRKHEKDRNKLKAARERAHRQMNN